MSSDSVSGGGCSEGRRKRHAGGAAWRLHRGLIAVRAIRFGYPACPNVEDQAQLLRLLDAERIGVSLSDESQLHPEQSTIAIVVLNPKAKYFSV